MSDTNAAPLPGIVDAHIHLWDTARFRYPWLDDQDELNRSFLAADFEEASEDTAVEKVVFIECDVRPDQQLAEASWAATLSNDEPRIAAIVASAELAHPQTALPHLEELSDIPLVRGIRRLIQNEPDPDFAAHPDFVRGVQSLESFDFSFDLCIRHYQLPAAIRLVQACPNIRFVLDHIAKPDVKSGELLPWAEHLKTLANSPNVYCKLSGVATEADIHDWTSEQAKPYVEHAIACFGFDRVMFASDWPVVTVASSYQRWFECLSWIVQGCSESEKRRLFSDNAAEFYRL